VGSDASFRTDILAKNDDTITNLITGCEVTKTDLIFSYECSCNSRSNTNNESKFMIVVTALISKKPTTISTSSVSTQSTPDQSATFDSTEEKEVLDDTETESSPADLENENPPVPENPETSPSETPDENFDNS
jgi:hypothetical protein